MTGQGAESETAAPDLVSFLDSVSERIEDQPDDVIADDDVQMALGLLAQVCRSRVRAEFRDVTL